VKRGWCAIASPRHVRVSSDHRWPDSYTSLDECVPRVRMLLVELNDALQSLNNLLTRRAFVRVCRHTIVVEFDEKPRRREGKCWPETLCCLNDDLEVVVDVFVLGKGPRVRAKDDAMHNLPNDDAKGVDIGFGCEGSSLVDFGCEVGEGAAHLEEGRLIVFSGNVSAESKITHFDAHLIVQ